MKQRLHWHGWSCLVELQFSNTSGASWQPLGQPPTCYLLARLVFCTLPVQRQNWHFFFFQSPLQLSCNIQILCSTIFEVVHVLNIFTPIKGAMKTKYSSLEKLLCPDNNGTNFMANWINSGDIKQNMLTSGSSLATFQQLFSVASQSHVCAIGNCQTNPSLRQMTAWL